MLPTLTQPRTRGSGRGGFDDILPGYGGGGGGREGGRNRFKNARLGLLIALGSITALFAALLVAYGVRSTALDWGSLDAPPLVFWNTGVLLLSSFAMERARRRFESWRPLAFRRWLVVTATLGATFLLGQLALWSRITEHGADLWMQPRGSFFYLFSGLHAAHLAVGLLVLVYVLCTRHRLLPGDATSPGLAAAYWHFMDGLWVCLAVVLFW